MAPQPVAPHAAAPHAAAPHAAAPQMAGPQAIPLAEVDIPSMHGDDDDDGGRTVMRESPGVSEIFRAPGGMQPGPAQGAPQAAWKPAPPPMQPFQGASSTERPGPGPAAQGGVSALIQETLENMGPSNAGGFPAPMGHETTGSAPGGMGAAGVSAGSIGAGGVGPGGMALGAPAGPFQPLGQAAQSPAFNAAPWTNQGGHEVSGSYAFGASAQAPQGSFGGMGGPQQGAMGGALPGFPSPQAGLESGAHLRPDMGFPPGGGLEGAPQGAIAMPGYPLGAAPGAMPAPKKRSRASLVIVCFLVLILAAAVTFSVLRFRAQLGF
ncbi:MAG: hypothetical protein HOW73_41015 [Polyangiaceae bacterium]|nr:hypothetical protein [Polyangiaceae bacterium]